MEEREVDGEARAAPDERSGGLEEGSRGVVIGAGPEGASPLARARLERGGHRGPAGARCGQWLRRTEERASARAEPRWSPVPARGSGRPRCSRRAEALRADNAGRVHEGLQPDRLCTCHEPGGTQSGDLDPGQVPPTGEGGGEWTGDVAPGGRCPPDHEALSCEGGGGEQAVVVEGKDRDRARRASRSDHDHHAARARYDVGAAHRSEVRPREPGACPEADKRRGPVAAALGRLGIGQGEVAGDLVACIRALRPLA